MTEITEFNPQNTYDYGINIETDDICADVNYCLVLPFTFKQAQHHQNFNSVPYLLTYIDEKIKIKRLIQEYIEMNPLVKNKLIQFTLKSGYKVSEDLAIRDLKLELGGANINGIIFFTNQLNLPEIQDDDSDCDIYQDQCCISKYLAGQQGFGSQYLNLIVQIQIPLKDRLPEVLTIQVNGELYFQDILLAIMAQIKLQFGITLTSNDISQIINKETKKPLQNLKSLITQNFYQKSKLILQLKDTNLKLKRTRAKDFNSFIIIYKEGEKEPKKFKYSQISEMTFSQVYNTYLELQESKQRKDLNYALKITDIIIKPNQKINLAQIYFKNQNKEPLNVVAKVVNQKMIFFHSIPSLINQDQDFVLDKLIQIPKNQEQKRKNVRQLSRVRAQKTKNQYFKVQQRLEPILIYTSQLKYFETKDKKQYKIYQSLNKFLRETPLLTLEEDMLRNQWRYLYSSALLKHLENIEKYAGKTHRGISYDPKTEVGKIITFKQFLSTSVSRITALSFAAKSSNPTKHMFELDLIQGYPIKQYSEYMSEQQILLQPFTDFEVVGIKQIQQEVGSKSHNFKIYSLKQLKTEKKLPDIRANFVVWIDDKPKEGQLIFSKIDMPTQTTILIQKLSTKDLVAWLKQNDCLFTDPTANLIFISNMCRNEDGQFKQLAGIQGLRQIRKYDNNVPVFFYIGDKVKARKKLAENQIDTKNVIVGNTPTQINKFILESINQKK